MLSIGLSDDSNDINNNSKNNSQDLTELLPGKRHDASCFLCCHVVLIATAADSPLISEAPEGGTHSCQATECRDLNPEHLMPASRLPPIHGSSRSSSGNPSLNYAFCCYI